MILKIAWKNFCGQGVRSILNVLVTAIAMVTVVFNVSMYNGFQAQATRNMVRVDVAGGHYRVPGFDLLTPTEWEDHTLPVPEPLKRLPPDQKAEVLILQGQIFPNRRLYPVQLRGIEKGQKLLEVPLSGLESWPDEIGDRIPVVLGTAMARKAHLKKDDTVVLKWRDKNGVVDARDALIVDVARIINARVDEGVIWLRLDHLRQMTQRFDEVTWVAVDGQKEDFAGFEYLSVEDLMFDLLYLLEQDKKYARITWAILIFLAGISVFNSQISNVFKRQKEIGTFMALGMTPGQVVRLFTLEGSLSAFVSVLAAAVLGTLFLGWFQTVGLDVSHLAESSIPVRERVYLDIVPWQVIMTAVIIVAIMVVISWLPVRKISRLDPTLALRGRGIT